jgi:hypothetical protein
LNTEKLQLKVSYLVYSDDELSSIAEEQTLLWSKLFYAGHVTHTAYGGNREDYLSKIKVDDTKFSIPLQIYVGGSREAEFNLQKIGPKTYEVTYVFEQMEDINIELQSMLKFLKSIYSVYNYPVGIVNEEARTLFNSSEEVPSDNYDVWKLNAEDIVLHPEKYNFKYCIVNSDFFGYYNSENEIVEVTGVLLKR